jgi:hypothetical protein
MRDLAAGGKKRTCALLVVLAGVFVLAVDVRLIAAHRPFQIGQLDASIVDAAVAAIGDAVLDFQFEVAGHASAPDNERVALEEGLRGHLADEAPVFDSPIHGIAVPILECLAIEDRLEALLVGGVGGNRIGLLRGSGHGTQKSNEDPKHCIHIATIISRPASSKLVFAHAKSV